MPEPCGAAHPTDETLYCTRPLPCFLQHQVWEQTAGGQVLRSSWPNPSQPPKSRPTRGGIKRPANVPEPATAGTPQEAWDDHVNGHRDGDTYDPEFDFDRLNAQAKRVYAVIVGGAWWTLAEISQITQDPEASISARLRDLRKPRFGGLQIERRARDREAGLFEYRLVK